MSSGQAFIIAYVRPCTPPTLSPFLLAIAVQKASYNGLTQLHLYLVPVWHHREGILYFEEYLVLLDQPILR